MKNKPTRIIYSVGLARELLDKGFKIRDIEPNKNEDGKLVFFFIRTKELEDYLDSKNIK